MDIQHAPLLIRERAHSAARPTASSAARSYCALAALVVLVAGMAAPCVPALAAEPLAVLREDNPSDPKQGKRYVGSTTWRTESIPPAAGRPAEVALRADVETARDLRAGSHQRSAEFAAAQGAGMVRRAFCLRERHSRRDQL
jgi:hypothetical protein